MILGCLFEFLIIHSVHHKLNSFFYPVWSNLYQRYITTFQFDFSLLCLLNKIK